MGDCLKHIGVISEELQNDWVVRVSVSSACAGCHARSSCPSIDEVQRNFRIAKDTKAFRVGDEVQVEMSRKDGMKAVVLAYLVPLCLFLLVLFGASSLVSQALACLFALLILVPYYFLLYRFSGVLNRSFHYSIEKIHEGL